MKAGFDWPITKLGEIAEVKGGKRLPKGAGFVESGFKYVRARDIRNGQITFNEPVYIDYQTREKIKRYTVNKGDICITIVGINIGDAGIVPEDLDSANLTENAAKLINLRNCTPKYLNYYLQSSGIKDQMQLFASGAAQDKLGLYKIKLLDVVLPPKEDQKRIAAILSAYDDLIENNKRRIALLEKMAEEIYREWFVRFRFPGYQTAEFEKGIPKGWSIKKIDDIVSRNKFGRIYRESELSEEGNVVVIDQSRSDSLGFYNGKPEHTASISSPKILFGDHTCKMVLIHKDFSLAENVVPFLPKDEMPVHFLFHLIKSKAIQTEYKRHWTSLVVQDILLPPFDLQNEFSSLVKSKYALIEQLKDQIRNLSKTKNLLLPRLISGKLSVEDLDIQYPPSMAKDVVA